MVRTVSTAAACVAILGWLAAPARVEADAGPAPQRLSAMIRLDLAGQGPAEGVALVVRCDHGVLTGVFSDQRGRLYRALRSDLELAAGRLTGSAKLRLDDGAFALSVDCRRSGRSIDGTWKLTAAGGDEPGEFTGRVKGVVTALAELEENSAVSAEAEHDWPSWRGPDGSGSAADADLDLVDRLSRARLAWVSDEAIPGGRVADSRRTVPKEGHLISGGFASPVVAEGRVYITYYVPSGDVWDKQIARRHLAADGFGKEKWYIDADDIVHCFDAATGRTLWRRTFRGEGMNYNLFNKGGPCNLSAFVAEGKVYAIGSGGKVYCLDAASGKVLWQSDIGPRYELLQELQAKCRKSARLAQRNRDLAGAPIVADGVVVCPDFMAYKVQNPFPDDHFSDAAGVIGLDAASGRRLWHRPGTLGQFATPVVWRSDGAEYVIAAGRETITCIRPRTGKVLWQSPCGGIAKTVALAGDSLVAGSDGDAGVTCYKLTDQGAARLWSLPEEFGRAGMPTVYAGHVYARCGGWRLVCAELKTGRVVGEVPVPVGGGFLAAVDGRLLMGEDCSHAVNAMHMFSTYPPRLVPLGWMWPAAQAGGYMNPVVPAFVDGRMFLRIRDGIACYDLRADSALPAGGAGERAMPSPDTATWRLVLYGFFDKRRPLRLFLHRRRGRWIAAEATARTWNQSTHKVDASGLTFEDGRLTGPAVITLVPDPWIPRDHRPITVTATLDATLKDGAVTGSYSGALSGEGTKAVGRILPLRK